MSKDAHVHSEMCDFNRPDRLGMDLQGDFIVGCAGGERFRLSRFGRVAKETETERSQFDEAVFESFQIIDGFVMRVATYASGKAIAESSFRKLVFELPFQPKGFTFQKSGDTIHFLVDDMIKSCPLADLEAHSVSDAWVTTPVTELGLSAIAVSGLSRFVGISLSTGGLVEIEQISGKSREVMPFGRAEEGGVRNLVSMVSDGYGNWAVLDRDNYRVVHKVGGGKLGFFGCKGSGARQLDWAGAAVMLDSQTLLIADTNNDRLVRADLVTQSTSVVAIRERCPDRLSRPVSIALGPRGISICERGNHRVTTVLEGRAVAQMDIQVRPGEQLSSFIPNRTDRSSFGLVLGRSQNAGFLRRISAHKERKATDYAGPLFDPQGMVACSGSRVLVSDTRNRKALLIDDGLDLVNEWDLASLSGNPRFLCRVPSHVRGMIYLPDYESGLTVCLDSDSWTVSLVQFRLDLMGLSAIRKLVAWGDRIVVLGRGKKPIVVLDSLFRDINTEIVGPLSRETSVPVDALDLGDGRLLVVDKEADALYEIEEKMLRPRPQNEIHVVLERLELSK